MEPIHSGHFMTSNLHKDEPPDDEDEEDIIVDVVDVEDEKPNRFMSSLPSTSSTSSRIPAEVATRTHHHRHNSVNHEPMEKTRTFYKFGPKKTQTIAIDDSLNKLNKCIKVAYAKMTTPKWKEFKGLRLDWKQRIRLNNVIWRAYYIEFRRPERGRGREQPQQQQQQQREEKPPATSSSSSSLSVLSQKKEKKSYCYFSVPDDDATHSKIEGSIIEGMYWKRRLGAVSAQYKRWRHWTTKQHHAQHPHPQRGAAKITGKRSSHDDMISASAMPILPVFASSGMIPIPGGPPLGVVPPTLFAAMQQQHGHHPGNASSANPFDGGISSSEQQQLMHQSQHAHQHPHVQYHSIETGNRSKDSTPKFSTPRPGDHNALFGGVGNQQPMPPSNFMQQRPGGTMTPGTVTFFDDDFTNVFTDTLFESLGQPYMFPNPREYGPEPMACPSNSDFMQPGLISLQPSIDEIISCFDDAPIEPIIQQQQQHQQHVPPNLRGGPAQALAPLRGGGGGGGARTGNSNPNYSAKEYDAASLLVDYSNQSGPSTSSSGPSARSQPQNSYAPQAALYQHAPSSVSPWNKPIFSSSSSGYPSPLGALDYALQSPGNSTAYASSRNTPQQQMMLPPTRTSWYSSTMASSTTATITSTSASGLKSSGTTTPQSRPESVSAANDWSSAAASLARPSQADWKLPTVTSTLLRQPAPQQHSSLTRLNSYPQQQQQQQQQPQHEDSSIGTKTKRSASRDETLEEKSATKPKRQKRDRATMEQQQQQQQQQQRASSPPVSSAASSAVALDTILTIQSSSPQATTATTTTAAAATTTTATATTTTTMLSPNRKPKPECASSSTSAPSSSSSCVVSATVAPTTGSLPPLIQKLSTSSSSLPPPTAVVVPRRHAADSTLQPGERKRVMHLQAEQNRRCALKDGFEQLIMQLPTMNTAGLKTTNAVVLAKAAEQIRLSTDSLAEAERERRSLQAQIEQLNTRIGALQTALPSTSRALSGSGGSSSVGQQCEQLFERLTRERANVDWRFWLMSQLLRPLVTSFGRAQPDSRAGLAEIEQATRRWADEWRGLKLRQLTTNVLVEFATKSPMLRDPSALADYVRGELERM